MSSVSVSTPSPSLLPSISSTNSDGGTQRGANYFFGFLITFVVLLLIFVGCGVGSRRRISMRRRRQYLGSLEPWTGTLNGELDVVEPQFFDNPVVHGNPWWNEIKPLSVLLLREHSMTNKLTTKSSTSTSPPTTTSVRPHSYFPAFLSSSWFSRRHPKPGVPLPVTDPSEELDPPVALQVAVLVKMPCHDVNHQHAQPEFHIGVARLPW